MNCLWCDTPLPAKNPHVPGRRPDYCSKSCRSAAKYGREKGKAKKLAEKTCVMCGERFQPRMERQVACSEYCGRRWNNKSRRGERGNSNYYRRLFILERGGVCERCGVLDGLEVHHIVPVAQGGPHVPSNVLVLCRPCHNGEHPKMVVRSPGVEPESYVSPFVGAGAKTSNLKEIL
jgi:5-methylcytosine-specific restriction protein A